ncbi:MAG TPA: TetR/AcrR family transcriptional regulator [Actinomycetota bacterium]
MNGKASTDLSGSATPALTDTRARLLEAADACLRTHGIPGATSRAIATEAGTNLQAIAYHFGSKDELVSEALVTGIRRWLEPALGILRTDMDPVRRMLAAVRELNAALDRAREAMPVYLEALAGAQRDERVYRAFREVLGEVHGFVSAQIAELKRRRIVPRWVDPDAMASLQIAAADGIAIHAALDPGMDHRAVAAQATKILTALARSPRARRVR